MFNMELELTNMEFIAVINDEEFIFNIFFDSEEVSRIDERIIYEDYRYIDFSTNEDFLEKYSDRYSEALMVIFSNFLEKEEIRTSI